MAKVPEPMHTTTAMIYAAYEEDADDGHRPHLGASLIGGPCERALWLTFHWARSKKFSGRMLRLFETGNLEEARMVGDLRRIGVTVHETDPDGKQWRVEALGGHFGGSMDGAAVGIPEAPKTWHVLEFKTHNEKSFKDLQTNGVEKSKPQHYAQMMVYMGMTGMDRAFYMAKNKNTDELYTERVEFDPVAFAKYMDRAERVIKANEPPLRVSQDPSWYVCKMCDFAELCHGDAVPEVNCRTCAHSTPETDGDGRWSCQDLGTDVGLLVQRASAACRSHRYIPILLERFATQKDYVNGDVTYESRTGTFANGETPGALSSLEIYAMEDKHSAGAAAELKRQLASQGVDSKVTA
jgi:hypothetical protein